RVDGVLHPFGQQGIILGTSSSNCGRRHMADLESAWRKWAWAARHAASYESDIERMNESTSPPPVIRCRAEYVARRHGFAVVVEEVTPIPDALSLRLGDIA